MGYLDSGIWRQASRLAGLVRLDVGELDIDYEIWINLNNISLHQQQHWCSSLLHGTLMELLHCIHKEGHSTSPNISTILYTTPTQMSKVVGYSRTTGRHQIKSISIRKWCLLSASSWEVTSRLSASANPWSWFPCSQTIFWGWSLRARCTLQWQGRPVPTHTCKWLDSVS